MRLFLSRFFIGLGLSLSLGVLPVQAQVTNQQVGTLVEALRQAAPQTGVANDGLYSDWQVMPGNIPRWSRSCIGRELSPAQFAADSATARTILTCVMRDVMQEELQASNNNESVAVRRAAAWWMTGDPNRYNTGDTATYTQRVLSLYQQGSPAGSTAPATPTPRPSPATPTANPQAQVLPSSVYDRYMQAGYTATQARDYDTALLYFQRALDERPNDTYALRAVRNVEGYRSRGNDATNSPPSVIPSPSVPTETSP